MNCMFLDKQSADVLSNAPRPVVVFWVWPPVPLVPLPKKRQGYPPRALGGNRVASCISNDTLTQ